MSHKKIEQHCKDWKMKCDPKLDPFPHTEVTKGPDSEDSWNELVNFLAFAYLYPNDDVRWIFRGVRDAKYSLESALERELNKREKLEEVDIITAEIYLLAQFKRAANHFLEASMVPQNEDIIEWLALMQHYGTPTRLIDFTRSPYIACFFALEEDNDNSECAIWAINENWFKKKSLSRIKDENVTSKEDLNSAYLANKGNFNNILYNISTSAILPVVPLKANQRLLVQQGLFLCSSAARKGSFVNNMLSYRNDESDMQENVYKIIIDNNLRSTVLYELNFMNINRSSLFPGLEGFATSLKHEIAYKSPDEIKYF
jgi:hypothetical protein